MKLPPQSDSIKNKEKKEEDLRNNLLKLNKNQRGFIVESLKTEKEKENEKFSGIKSLLECYEEEYVNKKIRKEKEVKNDSTMDDELEFKEMNPRNNKQGKESGILSSESEDLKQLESLKKDTRDFMDKYNNVSKQQIKQNLKNIESKFIDLTRQYRERGYKVEDVEQMKNIFNPSLLLIEEYKIDKYCQNTGKDPDNKTPLEFKYLNNLYKIAFQQLNSGISNNAIGRSNDQFAKDAKEFNFINSNDLPTLIKEKRELEKYIHHAKEMIKQIKHEKKEDSILLNNNSPKRGKKKDKKGKLKKINHEKMEKINENDEIKEEAFTSHNHVHTNSNVNLNLPEKMERNEDNILPSEKNKYSKNSLSKNLPKIKWKTSQKSNEKKLKEKIEKIKLKNLSNVYGKEIRNFEGYLKSIMSLDKKDSNLAKRLNSGQEINASNTSKQKSSRNHKDDFLIKKESNLIEKNHSFLNNLQTQKSINSRDLNFSVDSENKINQAKKRLITDTRFLLKPFFNNLVEAINEESPKNRRKEIKKQLSNFSLTKKSSNYLELIKKNQQFQTTSSKKIHNSNKKVDFILKDLKKEKEETINNNKNHSKTQETEINYLTTQLETEPNNINNLNYTNLDTIESRTTEKERDDGNIPDNELKNTKSLSKKHRKNVESRDKSQKKKNTLREEELRKKQLEYIYQSIKSKDNKNLKQLILDYNNVYSKNKSLGSSFRHQVSVMDIITQIDDTKNIIKKYNITKSFQDMYELKDKTKIEKIKELEKSIYKSNFDLILAVNKV